MVSSCSASLGATPVPSCTPRSAAMMRHDFGNRKRCSLAMVTADLRGA
jgi:hypothetical protein